ncbi:MAG: hypothetical protein H7645_12830 [Candidatus Heimdallarchaeota archaeon]|nr:hypothetical protein [Candidatus Heimdallarchaeota archaeon]MCK4771213.1 hypothetical protein [Candidatus Heimdallarchaeota archaeon]
MREDIADLFRKLKEGNPIMYLSRTLLYIISITILILLGIASLSAMYM